MMRLRHGRVSRAANQGIIHPADRLVEARPGPAEALPAAVVVDRRIAAEVAEAVASTVVEEGAEVALMAAVGAEVAPMAAVVAEAAAISD